MCRKCGKKPMGNKLYKNYIAYNENVKENVYFLFSYLCYFIHQLHPAMRGGPFPAGDVHQQKLEIFIEKTSALSKIFEPDTIDVGLISSFFVCCIISRFCWNNAFDYIAFSGLLSLNFVLQELSAIHEEYDRHKGSLANVVNHRDSSVMLIHGNLVQSITK